MTSPQANNVNVKGLVNVVFDIVHVKKQTYTITLFSHLYLTSNTNKVYNTFAHFFNVPLRVLNMLSDDVKASPHLDLSTIEYRLNAMITDVAHHRLFKPPQIKDSNSSESCRRLLKLNFTNKGIYADKINV